MFRSITTSFKTFLIVAFLCAQTVFAQKGYNFEFGGMLGFANYLGEIGGREKEARPFIMDMKLAKTRWSVGGYARYRLGSMLAVKASLNYLRIAGNDANTINDARKYRNLSFRNDIYDLEGTLQWVFYDSKKPIGIYNRSSIYFSSYLFAGVGGFYHNPKTNYQGSWVALQPIKTEGVSYSKFGFCVPMGGGFYVTINKRRRAHRIGIEINWRFTTTDYLDDISTVYKNPAELSSSTAVALSNRNVELNNQPEGFSGNYGWHGVDANGDPVNQAPRGNKDNKDSYLSLNVTYGMALKSMYKRSKGRRIRTVSF